MTPERWLEIRDLFHSAVALEPAARASFLARACAGRDSLRREVESLILSHEQTGSFIEAPAYEVAANLMAGQQPELRAGDELGPYKILSQLGSGGMGEVYLARDRRLERNVALKLLPASLVKDADRLHRFEREARSASGLNHPNILTVHEIGQCGDNRFIATEFIDGTTLRQRMQSARLSVDAALDIAAQTAAALAAAHEVGVVHRDIKPENIMVREDSLVKVLDFGLAKLTEGKDSAPAEAEASTRVLIKTTPGLVMGTVTYMSPEQARGKQVDARTDIFSLGVVMYEMLVGRSPFAGGTTSDVIAAILTTEPAPPSSFHQEIPAELDRIVSKSLTKEREERYQTAKDLLNDLRQLQKRLEFEAELERARFGVPPSGRRVSDAESPPPEGGTPNTHNSIAVLPFEAQPQETEEAGSSERQSLSAHQTAEPARAGSDQSENPFPELIKKHKALFTIGLVLLIAAVFFGYRQFVTSASKQIESIAVLPFVNESGTADVEYLSDGMTETLIDSLSQLPNLSVKARSSVFRYKGKQVEPQQVAAELSVRAVLNGRVVQRGDDLTLYLSLVDGRNGNQIWGEQYNRKQTDLVSLQSEIARDVSQKLRARLSGTDEQKLTKTYTANAEAYQLYLKGRYHLFKLTPPEIQTGISYFQQAIEIDPSYALAYVGLANAYRGLALSADMPATEFFPRAKDAAQKAVEIDDNLAEAHAVLGFTIFWYDWNWREAENQIKRALELDPNSADAHWFYSGFLSSMGRHSEALNEAKRARELDPLNLIIGAAEGQILVQAGRADEALASLQKTIELDPNFWFAHMFASDAYTAKGAFTEAVAEARKATEQPGGANSHALSSLGYALARSGKQAEARSVLDGLLKLSSERHVSPHNIALVYNSLGEHDKAITWLERGFKERDPKMVFLKVEPKWNNLRAEPRFQDLLRRVGLPQ